MAEAEATQEGDAPAGAPPARTLDLANIRGFQVLAVASQEPDAEGLDEETRKLELAKELAARAARLAEAVDEALVLANDGTIRWLGDPIAKLVAGEEALKPRAVILADEALSAEGRETVQQRVALWLAAHVRKALGPLTALTEPESVPEGVRDLALKLSQSFGVLERERVKAQVKALDQSARGALRKMGVRFGAFYIYVPALLKPASRTLCTQLWALVRKAADNETVAERLMHLASSGRTSFAVEPSTSAEVCRVAGFRLCGDRAVRVDIVERLTDLIRAALPRHAQFAAPAPTDEGGEGFVVTNQMTSLTGCSGEHFASILRSLGFASHKVKKSVFLAATSKAAAAASPVAEPLSGQSEDGGQLEAAPAAAAAGPIAATPAGRSEDDGEPEAATAALAEASPVAATPPEQSKESREREAATAEAQAKSSEDGSLGASAAGDESTPADGPSPGETDDGAVAPTPAAAQTSDAQDGVPHAGEEKPGEDELIEIWRPAPRRPRHAGRDRARPAPQAPQGEAAASPEERVQQQDARPARKSRRDRRHGGGAPRPARPEAPRAADPSPSGAAETPQAEPAREARRPPWRRDTFKGARSNDGRPAEATSADKPPSRPPPPEQRKPSVNLDSPFAKLLALKPLLKARDTTK